MMFPHLKALLVFLLFCLLIGLGVSSGSQGHLFDLAWIGFGWALMILASVTVLFRAWTHRDPRELSSPTRRGLWLLPLPRGVLRWLFDEHQRDGNGERRPRGEKSSASA